jgi:hypothetical protein
MSNKSKRISRNNLSEVRTSKYQSMEPLKTNIISECQNNHQVKLMAVRAMFG